MKHVKLLLLALLLQVSIAPKLSAQTGEVESRQSILQQPALPRLHESVLDVSSPAHRITGEPGKMQIINRQCRSTTSTQTRQDIVNTAIQEWGFFGFQVDDQTIDFNTPRNTTRPWRLPLNPEEVMHVASTIGAYWAATPDSTWILNRQNEMWLDENGLSTRWRDPWSAAFISWVMCESGLGEPAQFERAIAHHSYIDQAILAKEAMDNNAAYFAFEPGEAQIEPGDLLCSGLRPRYRSLEERRTQLGQGARTHCDIVVKVNKQAKQILTVGGNVRASVRMKIFPAEPSLPTSFLAPLPTGRIIFAHLKLQREESIDDALLKTPTLNQVACTLPAVPVTFAQANIELPLQSECS